MADRVLFISWGQPVAGREERSLEVFNEAVGLYGRKQQEGKIEGFDVVLLSPNAVVDGYFAIHGSGDQIAMLQEDEEFQRNMIDAQLIVEDLCLCTGYTAEGVGKQMQMYQDAIAKVPQAA